MRAIRKGTFVCFLVACLAWPSLSLSAQEVRGVTIRINNTATIASHQQIVRIPWKDLQKAYPAISPDSIKITTSAANKELPFQLEFRGETSVQNLLIQLDVDPGSFALLRLVKGQPSSFTSKTFCRYVPERKDDFAWENDKIAFRVYGKALEGTKENANGIDVWVKRTDRLVLNDRYKLGDYHIDHGDGLDYYHVGPSLGAGNIAPFVNDSIWYPNNYRQWKVLDNGPLRSTFQLSYEAWNVAGKMATMTKTISLDAGMQLSRIELTASFEHASSMPWVVGIIRRKEPGTILLDQANNTMGYWEPAHPQNGITGVGCIFPTTKTEMKLTDTHLLAVVDIKPNSPFVYYAGAAWNKAGDVTTATAWFNHLQHLQVQWAQPLTIDLLPLYSKPL